MQNFLKPCISLLVFSILITFKLKAQEAVNGPYTGKDNYKMSQQVEATFGGNWVKATIVGIDEAPSKYKIHFDGEKYCNNHATDSYLAREWVRPTSTTTNNNQSYQVTPPGGNATASKSTSPMVKVGEKVMYSNVGSLWLSGATVEAYDVDKRTYKLRFESGSGDIVPGHSVAKEGQFDNKFFEGKWDVYVNGAVITKVIAGEVYDVFSGGLKLAPLEIKANGSFIWRQKGKKDIVGRWTPRSDAPGITIHKGIDGKDWTIYEKTEGYSPVAGTKDEIGFHDKKSQTSYYVAYRIGANQSCVLVGRKFR